MSIHLRAIHVLAAVAVGLALAGCDGGEDDMHDHGHADHDHGEHAPNEQAGDGQPAGEQETAAVEYARQLMAEIEDYDTWPAPAGFDGWQDGTSPHGSVLRYYVNEIAQNDPTADGAVIVKENYSQRSDDALKSVTVMKKRAGYDPETKDWFYVKYAPDGTVMSNPAGRKLAGLVGKGGNQGCLPCHATAGGDDYVFMND